LHLRFVIVLFIGTLTGCAVISKNPIQATSIAIKGVEFAFSLAVPSEIPVESTGMGSTREIAIQNALISAVQEVMGVLVVSEVSVQNNKLLNDLAIAYSNGVVNKYSIKGCVVGERVSCTIHANVSTKNIKLSLAKNSSATEIDGRQIYSQYITNKNAITQRKKLLEYYFSRIEKFGLDLKIRSIETIPTDGSKVPIKITYSISWNDEFKTSFYNLLVRLQKESGAENYPSPPGLRGGNADAFDKHQDLRVSFGKTIFSTNDIYIKLKDYNLVKRLNQYIYPEMTINYMPFNACEKISLPGSVFTISEKGGITKSQTIYVSPNLARNTRTISIKFGCDSK
jgi:hypothetical protein